MLGYFYYGQDERLKDERAVRRAVDEATSWLLDRDILLITVTGDDIMGIAGQLLEERLRG